MNEIKPAVIKGCILKLSGVTIDTNPAPLRRRCLTAHFLAGDTTICNALY